MESVGLNVDDVMSRTKWKMEIQNYSGDPQMMEICRALGEEDEQNHIN